MRKCLYFSMPILVDLLSFGGDCQNDWAQMKTELNKTCAFSLKRG